MAANTPITNITKQAQNNLIEYYKTCRTNVQSTWDMRNRMQQIDKIYQRELDYTQEQIKARAANRAGDPTKYQNVIVPVVLPAVESAVTYQSSVFLTGIPLFGVSATANAMDVALQMETIIDDQATRGGWIRELQLFFRDGFKYNLAAMEVEWAQEKTYIPTTNEIAGTPGASSTKLQETLWEGNKIRRLDLYNTIFDPRVIPAEIASRGEFAGYSQVLSRVELVKYLQSLQFRLNYREALECGFADLAGAENSEYFIPTVNLTSLLDPKLFTQFSWGQWAGLTDRKDAINFKNAYIKTVFYARVIPKDFGLPAAAPNQPQIWKFVFINGSILVYAERQTNAHDLLPILFSQPLEDGLGFQAKSLAQNSAPFQEVASALVNSAIQARRRAVSDRGIYNPSLIEAKHINNDSATAKIPLRPAAFGRSASEAYYPIPFRDEQSQQSMSDVSAILRFNEMVTGQNAAQQGQFVKGNKTLVEWESTMGAAAGRSQNTAILLESQFFTPLKEILKLNVLQYQKPSQIYNRETETTVQIDPVALRKASITFKVSDGLTPASKQMNTDAFQAACQTLAAVPQLSGAYNLGPMFSYLFKLQRADVAQFEKSPEQIAYEQAAAQWQQAAMTLAEALNKSKKPDGSAYTPQEIQQALPPQPQPQQFNYDPSNPKPQQAPQGTILQQLAGPQQ